MAAYASSRLFSGRGTGHERAAEIEPKECLNENLIAGSL